MRIRAGGAADIDAIMAMGDEAVRWMVSRGNTQQWGTDLWSETPTRLASVTCMIKEADVWMAELDGEPVGVMITSDKPVPQVKPIDEPEVYVWLLLTSRRHAGKKIGTQLLEKAVSIAREKGVSLLRVDCFGGGNGDLVRYYERHGFEKSYTFKAIFDWPGQVLSQRI
ncbi:GNAT family N-acetyltransferase [Kibdelosporangium philippinense]|uniref:GNAT family N-acetyltransferase n=1 Tax=Kibdelosporangium philippinense TaxID=211113 RepID=A0ABS8ZXU8_9PSEU|nr:GNAT family N-acetyltransferase [Kibdelosporangium philippinense]MCE7011591.1 GNAT family N-acetyltransferase [Kibdelosporangium philippinense]